MAGWVRTFRLALVSGSVASATSSLSLALLARRAGKGAFQPLNATSHWLHGEQAASRRQADLAHTAVGYATHHAATLFWAVLFERWIGARRPLSPVPMLCQALAWSAVAAAIDYRATPRRFTPGWEFVLPKRSMGSAYAAMGLGLAAGALMTQRGPASARRG